MVCILVVNFAPSLGIIHFFSPLGLRLWQSLLKIHDMDLWLSVILQQRWSISFLVLIFLPRGISCCSECKPCSRLIGHLNLVILYSFSLVNDISTQSVEAGSSKLDSGENRLELRMSSIGNGRVEAARASLFGRICTQRASHQILKMRMLGLISCLATQEKKRCNPLTTELRNRKTCYLRIITQNAFSFKLFHKQ